ncbi:MAG: hypothetical protein H0U59_12805 [Gemmatimonadaceae bacterium]|nr:hypothetical protein [Gemmatimonadaceae bacterium]
MTRTEGDGRRTVLTTNNAYDTVLLCDGDLIVSQWTADDEVIRNYLRDGADAADWDVQDADGIEVDGRLAVVGDYGEVAGQEGKITDEDRRGFWSGAA